MQFFNQHNINHNLLIVQDILWCYKVVLNNFYTTSDWSHNLSRTMYHIMSFLTICLEQHKGVFDKSTIICHTVTKLTPSFWIALTYLQFHSNHHTLWLVPHPSPVLALVSSCSSNHHRIHPHTHGNGASYPQAETRIYTFHITEKKKIK